MKRWLGIVGVVLVVWLLYSNQTSKTDAINKTHPIVFFDQDLFFAGIDQIQKSPAVFFQPIQGGVVPHHLLASYLIADFFALLKTQNPQTVILIGPNHFEKGEQLVLTSNFGWQTPFGVVEPDTLLIESLVKTEIAAINGDVLVSDHAVAALMPYLKHYLPHTKVVPLLVSGHMDMVDITHLANELSESVSKDVILVAAVDFSHYLASDQAKLKDKTTWELMTDYNYNQLLRLGNDYLDSPPSIVTLLKTMTAVGATHNQVLHHTNSGEMQHNSSIQTTSYFSIAYY